MTASKAQSENELSAVDRPLKEGKISFTAFDDRVDCAVHLGSDCAIRLAAQMGVVTVSWDEALEFVAEAVGTLQDCDLFGQQVGLAGNEGLAQSLAGAVQDAAIQPSAM